MRVRLPMWFTKVLVLAVLCPNVARAVDASGGGGVPGRIVAEDPLTRPAPSLVRALRFPLDERGASEKIQPTLWEEALKGSPGDQISIIVNLQEPELLEALQGTSREADDYRVQWVASLAHGFATAARAAGMEEIRALSHFPILFGKVDAAGLIRVAAIENVRSIEFDAPVHEFRSQAGALMNANVLRTTYGGNGAGVEVAVVDSGVFPHNEFASRIRAQGDFTGGSDGTVDGSGHGTSVAGIIAGTSGMARAAGLWAIKVLDSNGSGQLQWILNALNAVYASRDSFGGLDVINMSLGSAGPYNSDCDAQFPSYATAINQLVAAGIPVFVASGNDGHLNGVSSPACLSNVISVGAVYDGTLASHAFSNCTDPSPVADMITCYSNSGNPLDILAPSHDSSTTKSGGGYVSNFGGTSAASPYAAGVGAQILSLRPNTTPAQLRAALRATGKPITDVNGITRNRVNAVQAYQQLAAGGGGPCVPGPTTLCIDNNPGDRRFRVEISYQSALNGGISGSGKAIALSSLGINKGGLFWFFSADNPEALIKVINGCGSNGKFWLFYSAGTNLGMTTTVTDTIGSSPPFVIVNPDLHAAAPVATISAFNCP